MIEYLHAAQDDEQRLEQAFDWLCKQRNTAPDNADIWDLRFHWATRKGPLLQALQTGNYQLQPMRIVGKTRQVMWSAENALALKWLALDLENTLPLHRHCEHVKGHGGGNASLQQRHDDITQAGYRWVCRTDIKGYYQHINKTTLFAQLQQHVRRPAYLNLLSQYLHYSVEDGGEFFTPESGIARGCSLSPLMGAFHLWTLDNHFASQKKIAYARYMDDFVILTHTRWSLRKQVKRLNQFFNEYGFKQHPDKTFIGKVEKGFDWLGGQFGAKSLEGVSARAWANHRERLRRLYERTRLWAKERRQVRVASYQKRWKIWFVVCVGGGGATVSHAIPQFTTGPGTSVTVSGSMGSKILAVRQAAPQLMTPGTTVNRELCLSQVASPLTGGWRSCDNSVLVSDGVPLWVGGPSIPAGRMYVKLPSEPIWIMLPTLWKLGMRNDWGWTATACNQSANFANHLWGGPAVTVSDGSLYNRTNVSTWGNAVLFQITSINNENWFLCNDTGYSTGSYDFTAYVSPAASIGTHLAPKLYLRSLNGVVEVAYNPGHVEVKTDCKVGVGAGGVKNISFGSVAAGTVADRSLGSHDLDIGVECKAGFNTNKATYSVSPSAGGATTDGGKTLSLINTGTGVRLGGVTFVDKANKHLAGTICTAKNGFSWDGVDRALSDDGTGKWGEELSFFLCSSGLGGGGGCHGIRCDYL